MEINKDYDEYISDLYETGDAFSLIHGAKVVNYFESTGKVRITHDPDIHVWTMDELRRAAEEFGLPLKETLFLPHDKIAELKGFDSWAEARRAADDYGIDVWDMILTPRDILDGMASVPSWDDAEILEEIR